MPARPDPPSAVTAAPAAPLARLLGIGKRFGPVPVLQDVDLVLHPGEVHVLAGENGAGKSTLVKILGGVYRDFDGILEIGGRRVRPASPLEAAALGVAVIHQELSLVPTLSVADNLFLGCALGRFGFVDRRAQRGQARRLLDALGIRADPDCPVEDLPVGTRQLVEVARAAGRQARVMVMDEPTSALNQPEAAKLFALVADLKVRGCAIVYITHKMEEIGRLADRITVLRDGRVAGSGPAADFPPDRLVRLMVGRDLEARFSRHAPAPGRELLRAERFSVYPKEGHARPAADRVCLALRAGEILGVAGLQGSGATELLGGLYGRYGRRTAGEVTVEGKPYRPSDPAAALARGLALLPHDRKTDGLAPGLSVTANATLADLPALSPGGWRRPEREREAARALARALAIRAASLDMPAGELSGGNQQKVLLARCLQVRPRILLLDEPTRGVDVGAKREIYQLMDQWTREGMGILLITSEMPELLAMSDRILVLHRSRPVALLEGAAATAEGVLEAAMGNVPAPAEGGVA